MKKLILLLVISTSLLLACSLSCQRGEKSAHDGPTIALVMKTLNNPFFIDMQKGAESASDSLNINLIVQAAEREVDVEKQMQIIENLLQRKVDALCITPSGSKEIIPAIVKANTANIPVLIVDTRVDSVALAQAGGRIDTFIGSDNFEGGKIAGEYIVDKLNTNGQVAILEGIPGHETGDARLSGFHSIVDTVAGIEIVTSQTANWERDQGFNVFQNIMQSYPHVNALFACNDMMALGAIEAIAAAGRTGEIVVVGFDAVSDARVAIEKGQMDGSIAQHPFDMGRLVIESAYRLINEDYVPDYVPVAINMVTQDTK